LVTQIEKIIDNEETIKHSTLAERTEAVLQDPQKIDVKLRPENVESCYTPIVQSGGKFNLKPSAESDDHPLKFSTIICSLGARYRYYCSNIARTYLIDPDKEQEEHYKVLFDLQQHVLKVIKPGVVLGTTHMHIFLLLLPPPSLLLLLAINKATCTKKR
jgi:nucleosome binding factor SPN SPT16 subunit